MTAREFIDKYTGVVVPGAPDRYRGQCVDLAQLYAKEVCGDANPYLGDARGWWTNYNPNLYERIANTPTFIPQLGDIAVWSQSYGHISICNGEGNLSTFQSLDNNWPWGLEQNDHPTAIITHNYTYYGFLGVLRPKGGQVATDIENLYKNAADQQVEINALKAEVSSIEAVNQEQWDKMATKEDIEELKKMIAAISAPANGLILTEFGRKLLVLLKIIGE